LEFLSILPCHSTHGSPRTSGSGLKQRRSAATQMAH
jgi:hypothetical protein